MFEPWRIEPHGEGFRIIDHAGQIRGSYANARTMALHFVSALQKLDAIRRITFGERPGSVLQALEIGEGLDNPSLEELAGDGPQGD